MCVPARGRTMYALILAMAPAPDAGSFVVTTAGEVATGRVLRVSAALEVTLASRTGETTLKDLVSLRRAGRVVPAFPTRPQIITTNGDRLAGELVGIDRDSLRFSPGILPPLGRTPWSIPLSSTGVLWLTDLPAELPVEPPAYPWLQDNRNRDVLRFRNGDTARGILLGPAPDADKPTFRLRPEAGEVRSIPAGELAAVAFNPLLAKSRPPKGPYARVVLSDGSRLSLVGVGLVADVLTGETHFGRKVELPLEAVVALDVLQGKAVYLSDLKPAKVEQAGFLGPEWPWRADRTVRGVPLRLTTEAGDTTFDKGLGTHPRSRLTYDLGGKYRRFEALVGLDPETGDRGRAVVRVLVDGKEQAVEGLPKLGAGRAVPVRIDVSGAKHLTLEVDFGPAGGVRADVNWGDARLVE